jgi:hypothetical protein
MLDPVSITVSVLSLLLTLNDPDTKIRQTSEFQECFSHRVERFGERITPKAVAAIDRICLTFTKYALDRRKQTE